MRAPYVGTPPRDPGEATIEPGQATIHHRPVMALCCTLIGRHPVMAHRSLICHRRTLTGRHPDARTGRHHPAMAHLPATVHHHARTSHHRMLTGRHLAMALNLSTACPEYGLSALLGNLAPSNHRATQTRTYPRGNQLRRQYRPPCALRACGASSTPLGARARQRPPDSPRAHHCSSGVLAIL